MNTLLHFLVGAWFISSSNFPMWTKGNKIHPTFNYTLITKKDGSELLFDEVKYLKKEKHRAIKGYDRPDTQDSTAFVWKGKGALSLLKSKWKVVIKDPAGEWAVIFFSKTLFTPEGVDIIGRKPLSEERIRYITSLMLKDPLLKEHVSSLKPITHN